MYITTREHFEDPPEARLDEALALHRHANRNNGIVLLFIHGLGGHRVDYWGDTLRYVFDDQPGVDLATYYYRTSWRRLGLTSSIDFAKEAQVLAHHLRDDLKEYSKIILIGHSMGGLLAKAAIGQLVEEGRWDQLYRIGGLILLASPQLGSLRVPSLFRWFSRDFRVLYRHNSFLTRLDRILRANFQLEAGPHRRSKPYIPTWAVVAANDFWVDYISAALAVPITQVRLIHGKHSQIVRPDSRDRDGYRALSSFIQHAIDFAKRPRPFKEYDSRPASREDAAAIIQLAITRIDPSITETAAEIAAFIERAPNCFQIISKRSKRGLNRTERIEGYYCIFPLTAEAAELVRKGELTGAGIIADHIERTNDNVNAVYLGAIAAQSRYAKGLALSTLRMHVRGYVQRNHLELFSRPVTEKGLRLLEERGFVAKGERGIGKLYHRIEKPAL